MAETPVSGWGSVQLGEYEDWSEADAAYSRAVARAGRRGSLVAQCVRLIPYRTRLRGRALFDELLALDDFDVLPAAREFRP